MTLESSSRTGPWCASMMARVAGSLSTGLALMLLPISTGLPARCCSSPLGPNVSCSCPTYLKRGERGRSGGGQREEKKEEASSWQARDSRLSVQVGVVVQCNV